MASIYIIYPPINTAKAVVLRELLLLFGIYTRRVSSFGNFSMELSTSDLYIELCDSDIQSKCFITDNYRQAKVANTGNIFWFDQVWREMDLLFVSNHIWSNNESFILYKIMKIIIETKAIEVCYDIHFLSGRCQEEKEYLKNMLKNTFVMINDIYDTNSKCLGPHAMYFLINMKRKMNCIFNIATENSPTSVGGGMNRSAAATFMLEFAF